MQIEKLDHINIRTGSLEDCAAWYRDVLGLEQGPRPPFGRPGAWMYAGGHPVVHISVRDGDRPMQGDSQFDHVAFFATDLAGSLASLRERRIAYRCVVVPETGIRQVFFHDPEGNKIELDFAPGEQADLANYDGR